MAKFLVKDAAKNSILIDMGDENAKLWTEIRNATPIFGWVSVEEAEEILREFLK